ncbi:hypothetical protein HDV00_009753 [Rhizophlyctis rosea]|nr:hypothetical protein HDV00_009753 [Rhizophlyctis rosea]
MPQHAQPARTPAPQPQGIPNRADSVRDHGPHQPGTMTSTSSGTSSNSAPAPLRPAGQQMNTRRADGGNMDGRSGLGGSEERDVVPPNDSGMSTIAGVRGDEEGEKVVEEDCEEVVLVDGEEGSLVRRLGVGEGG